jgi:hypothetical protein
MTFFSKKMDHRVKPGDDDLKYVCASRLFEIRIGKASAPSGAPDVA